MRRAVQARRVSEGWSFRDMSSLTFGSPGRRWRHRQGHVRPRKRLRPGYQSKPQQGIDGTLNIRESAEGVIKTQFSVVWVGCKGIPEESTMELLPLRGQRDERRSSYQNS